MMTSIAMYTCLPSQASIEHGLVLLLDASLKGLVVLIVAGLVAAVMRKKSAAGRHLVWVLGISSLLLIPVMSVTLPQWQVLPGWFNSEKQLAVSTTPIVSGVLPETTSVIDDSVIASPSVVMGDGDIATEASPVQTAGWWRALSVDDIVRAAFLAWATVAAICLLPLILGQLSLSRLRRSAQMVNGGSWAKLLCEAAGQVGTTRQISLYRSEKRSMPMVWGIFRCKLLLPAEADDWSAAQREHVLLHELAHVARWDCLSKLIGRVACSFYWFNPLAWYVFKRLQREAEVACDDLVIKAGGEPSVYAEQILQIATNFKTSGFASSNSIAMARKSTLESRLMAILDGGRNRRAMTRVGSVVAIVIAMGLVLPVSVMRATEVKEKADEQMIQTKDVPSETLNHEEKAEAPTAVSINFKDEPFIKVIEYLRQSSGMEIDLREYR